MNILYIAYSCDPYNGSEDKIGWNVPLESAKSNRVYVITKVEQREAIERYLSEHKVENLQFFYVDIPDFYKKVFKGFFYSGRLNLWNKRAFPLAQKLCREKEIDLIHQITPVEFRSIGNYGKIKGVKFVCGPIAGGQKIPVPLKEYVGKYRGVELVRSGLNLLYQSWFRISGKLRQCDYVLFANQETKEYLMSDEFTGRGGDLLTDISIGKDDLIETAPKRNHVCRLLVVGRLVYLKGHDLLLDALYRLPRELNYECRVVGDGPEMQRLKEKCQERMLQEHLVFAGAVAHSDIAHEYDNADVLVMPSLREATGSVILEAMARGLPVVTINRFGGATILDQQCGWLYDGNTQNEYIENLKDILITCITKHEEVIRKGKNARKQAEKYTWESRIKQYQQIYEYTLKCQRIH